ncbi:Glutathione transferase GST 23 [Linum perenne]
MADIKLLGTWPSPFSYLVIWALKLKDIDYEYIPEDLSNKSQLLLQSNPVHKKIPVLIHGGKPISESMIILQYLDDSFPESYPLMPTDPYEKAVARFWIKFAEDKLSSAFMIFRTSGEEQRKAVEETLEVLKILEEHAFGPLESKYFGGDEMVNIVDLAYGVMGYWLDAVEYCTGVKVFDPLKFPRFHGWIGRFNDAPVIRDNLPDREELFAYFKRRREMILSAASN